MLKHRTILAQLATLPFDTIIDVRSPAEFAIDHIPGAINLPALSNEERIKVGTIYVQQDPFLARKVGAALVARNAAVHLEGPLADKSGAWRPLVYCWRGGQRSGSLTSILQQVGWRADKIEGGYKTYRRLVADLLHTAPIHHRLTLIDGGTGSGKTELLKHLAALGAQVIDLEALAEHRGSLFGGRTTPQPSQKLFESRLAMALTACDPTRPIYVEAESNKIGKLLIPPSFWRAMITAQNIQITAPLAARAHHLVTTYGDLTADAAQLAARIDRLRPYHSAEKIKEWLTLAQDAQYETLAAALMEHHYDPRYAKTVGGMGGAPLTFALDDLAPQTLAQTAHQILDKTGGV